MFSPITDRIIADSGYPDVLEWLSERLSGDDFYSLLLEIFHRRSQQVAPKDLLRAYEQNRFVQPARVSPNLLLELDLLAMRLGSSFEFMELSPLAPLGTCSALATVHQHKVVSALRKTEVVSDPTNLMALEIARRRKILQHQPQKRNEEVHLLCSQRVSRAQHFHNPEFSAHFRILCLCSGGRDQGHFRFETTTLISHLRFYLRMISESRSLNYQPGAPQVRFSDFVGHKLRDAISREVIEPLKEAFPETEFSFRENSENGKGYYHSFRFNIEFIAPNGDPLLLVDGGDTQWTRQLLSSQKERLITSGMGTQLYAQLFRTEH